MDFLSKVNEVRNRLDWTVQTCRNEGYKEEGCAYVVQDFATINEMEGDPNYGQEKIFISKQEHRDILRYLSKTGYIELLEDKPSQNSVLLKLLPKATPTIKLKTLELISRELKDQFTGTQIVSLLKGSGVDERFIIYPASKWEVFYKVFSELAISKDDKDKELLFQAICDAIHPLNLEGDSDKSYHFQHKFNEYLQFDNLYLHREEKGFKMYYNPTSQEMDEMSKEWEEDRFKQEEFLCKPENREKISQLRKYYQSLMNVVYAFCQNTSHPTTQLNDAYKFLTQSIWRILAELDLLKPTNIYSIHNYSAPFSNLFGAEKHYRELGKELSWQKIRPEMNAVYGEIEELYRTINGDEILAEPDKQQKLNEIELLLSKLKKQKEIAKKMKSQVNSVPVSRIEITAIPDIVLKQERVLAVKPKHITQSQTEGLKAESVVGQLVAFSDGSIRYGEQILDLRNQLKVLCRLFMGRPNLLTTLDMIRDEVISAPKRKYTSFKTISKYVSELHNILQNYFKIQVIFNQKEEGWYFKPPK